TREIVVDGVRQTVANQQKAGQRSMRLVADQLVPSVVMFLLGLRLFTHVRHVVCSPVGGEFHPLSSNGRADEPHRSAVALGPQERGFCGKANAARNGRDGFARHSTDPNSSVGSLLARRSRKRARFMLIRTTAEPSTARRR